jgi:hypothetical protein
MFVLFLILGSSIYSLREYSKYSNPFHQLKFMRFEKKFNLLIANENSKDEFVIISPWNFTISSKTFLQFDIWTMIDLHKLYWIVKFNNKVNKMGLINKLQGK